MNSNKLVVALAFLLSATSASLAQSQRYHRAQYGYGRNYGAGIYNYYGGAQPGYSGNRETGYTSGQPGPGSGIESQR